MTTTADDDLGERLAALIERYADKANWSTDLDHPLLGYVTSITLEWRYVEVMGPDRWSWRIAPAGWSTAPGCRQWAMSSRAISSRLTFEAEDDAKFDALQELARLVRSTPAAEARSLHDALTACRMAMAGLPLEHKHAVFEALRDWIDDDNEEENR